MIQAATLPVALFTLPSSLFTVFTGSVMRRQTVRLQTSDWKAASPQIKASFLWKEVAPKATEVS